MAKISCPTFYFFNYVQLKTYIYYFNLTHSAFGTHSEIWDL